MHERLRDGLVAEDVQSVRAIRFTDQTEWRGETRGQLVRLLITRRVGEEANHQRHDVLFSEQLFELRMMGKATTQGRIERLSEKFGKSAGAATDRRNRLRPAMIHQAAA